MRKKGQGEVRVSQVRSGRRSIGKDRLVEKNREEYEHRVPRETVLVLLRHLVSSVEEARVFDIDGLFLIRNTTGEDVPGYQVYVVVAWPR